MCLKYMLFKIYRIFYLLFQIYFDRDDKDYHIRIFGMYIFCNIYRISYSLFQIHFDRDDKDYHIYINAIQYTELNALPWLYRASCTLTIDD